MVIETPKLVLFDIDGTLVDSVPDLSFCVDEMMRELGLAERGEDKARLWVGNGVVKLVERALTDDMEATPNKALFEKAMPIFDALYAENTAQRSVLYDGVREGLSYVKHQGYKIGAVTNKAERFTLPLLKQLGIFETFENIVSGDTYPQKKPHPMPLLESAKHFDFKPSECLMIGDSKSDVAASRAAEFGIICMSYGYNHGEDIHNYNPDAVIDNMRQLKEFI